MLPFEFVASNKCPDSPQRPAQFLESLETCLSLSPKIVLVIGETWGTHTHIYAQTHTHTHCISPSPVQDWDSLKICGSQTLPPQLKAILLKVIAEEFTIRQQEKKGAI